MAKLLGKSKAKKLADKQVTQETLDDHREAVLLRGRKLKASVTQLQKRVVGIAAGIALAIVVAAGTLGYLSLYVFQSTGDVAFRIAEVLPLPVARVDGEWVNYGEYLLVFRSSIRPVEQQGGPLQDNEENHALLQYYKRRAMDLAIRYAYARRMARELDIRVERRDIDDAIREFRTVDGQEWSEERFTRAVFENFGLTRRQYERLVGLTILLTRVTEAMDTRAQEAAEGIEQAIEGGVTDFEELFEMFDGVEWGASDGFMGEMDLDGGRARMALTLEVGEVSRRFVSRNGDGFFFVRALDRENGRVQYESLFIPFVMMNERIDYLWDAGRITKFITIESE